MKKMITVLLVFAGLALCALLFLQRHRRVERSSLPRVGTPSPTVVTQPPSSPQPMDAFQTGVKLDTRTGAQPEAEAKRQLLKRLQREEERQKPQEQRN